MYINTLYKCGGTKSFRLSASRFLGKAGVNLQNPPPTLLECIEAPAGYLFLQRDQAGAEALIVAYEIRDGYFRELFKVGIKPHVYMALQIFIDKFRGSYPKERYYFRRPKELRELPGWPEMAKVILELSERYGTETYHRTFP
jgi:hypothetical protein